MNGRLVCVVVLFAWVVGCNCGGGGPSDGGVGGGAGGGIGGGAGGGSGGGAGGGIGGGAGGGGGSTMDGGDDAGTEPDAGADAGTSTDAGTDAGVVDLARYATQVSGSGFHLLIVGQDGGVSARGRYDCGQDGIGSPTNQCPNPQRFRTTSVPVTALPAAAVSVHAFGNDSFALLSDGSVWAWGMNCSSLGISCFANGSTQTTNVPSAAQVGPVRQLAIGDSFSVVLLADAGVQAWGYNLRGQLGDGTTTSSSTPVSLPGVGPALHVAAGQEHGLAVQQGGTVWVWGRNQVGQHGNGGNALSPPEQVPGLTGVRRVYAQEHRSYALKADGTVWAWGNNGARRLGLASPQGDVVSPTQLPNLSDITELSVDCFHGLALKSDGTVWLWGGELPDGTATFTATPAQVPGISNARAIFCQAFNSYVVLADGRMVGWGPGNGFLGSFDGGPSDVPVDVADLY